MYVRFTFHIPASLLCRCSLVPCRVQQLQLLQLAAAAKRRALALAPTCLPCWHTTVLPASHEHFSWPQLCRQMLRSTAHLQIGVAGKSRQACHARGRMPLYC